MLIVHVLRKGFPFKVIKLHGWDHFSLRNICMHELLLRFPRVDIHSRILQPEVRFVLAVNSLNEDGFDVLVQNTVTVFCCFASASRY